MDAAVAALIGAGIGAIVPVVDGIRRDRRDDAREKREREDAETERLFIHRREAILEFVTAATDAIHGPPSDRSTDDPAYAALAGAYAKVGLGVTRATWDRARIALDQVEACVFGGGSREFAQSALDSFVAAAQEELGFDQARRKT
jgi:hypothetical protein